MYQEEAPSGLGDVEEAVFESPSQAGRYFDLEKSLNTSSLEFGQLLLLLSVPFLQWKGHSGWGAPVRVLTVCETPSQLDQTRSAPFISLLDMLSRFGLFFTEQVRTGGISGYETWKHTPRFSEQQSPSISKGYH